MNFAFYFTWSLLLLHFKLQFIWDKLSCNVRSLPSDRFAQRRLKSGLCIWSETSLSEETMHPRLSKTRPVKILIRLRECAVWSESSLGAHVRRYVFWRYGCVGYRHDVAATFCVLCMRKQHWSDCKCAHMWRVSELTVWTWCCRIRIII